MQEAERRIDGYRFLDGASKRVMKAWAAREPEVEIPWTPLDKPLSEARVALVSSAALSLREDQPFDREGERQNPWWGDPSYRVLPREATREDVRVDHLHINPQPASEDLDCIFPLRRLDELVKAEVVGSSAPRHYSIMGYILDTGELLEETAPKIAEGLVQDEVDVALLVPV
ncbi:MAG: hypothetical protein KDD47_17460 [Acidobacteria bacterium]|nr:hypothetical protein [Acidobacteriota bacterium]